jgi:hypothetical protein
MKTSVQILAALFCCLSTAHAAEQVVVPNNLANTEGNSSSADLFNTTGSLFQQVYSASEFALLGAPTGRIDGLSFRLDGETTQRIFSSWGVVIILSTTTQSPDFLNPRFGDNAGPDAVIVYSGPFGVNIGNDSLGLQPFAINIPFETPFFYDLSKGNLSMYFSAAPGRSSMVLDAQSVIGDSVGRVYGGFSTTGTPDTLLRLA